jgi:hypothetical protein
MIMPWFLPVGLLVGVAGTRTTIKSRRLKGGAWDRDWWLLPLLSWLPFVCWLTAQFVVQG